MQQPVSVSGDKKSRAGKTAAKPAPAPAPAGKLGPKFKGLDVKPRKTGTGVGPSAEDKVHEEKLSGDKAEKPMKSHSMTTLELQKALRAGQHYQLCACGREYCYYF